MALSVHLRGPQLNTIAGQVTTLVVRDKFGTPCAIILEIADGTTQVITAGDEEFNATLRLLGFSEQVTTQKLDLGANKGIYLPG